MTTSSGATAIGVNHLPYALQSRTLLFLAGSQLCRHQLHGLRPREPCLHVGQVLRPDKPRLLGAELVQQLPVPLHAGDGIAHGLQLTLVRDLVAADQVQPRQGMVTGCMIRSGSGMMLEVQGFLSTRMPAKVVPLAKAAMIWSVIRVPTMIPCPGR
ncbi:hypothetical protein G6F50_016321 [Rhizopus delemar]|uniref:Uncharacterized protein n=1 Tax=Rhizopus delemar TaxID=936053 RepID=A0A9P6XU32_9FUNG|nr:hypothetical protein G6F50_016321 [Rhizopus delemar]